MAYTYHRQLTIDHTKVGTVNNTDQTNFSVLLGGSAGPFTYLKTLANGGKIQNTVSFNGQTVPADLIFTSDLAGTTLLNWEIASYKATTGDIEVWINIPTLSHLTDTVIYMFYGNVAVVTYQGGSVGAAWDANYRAVYHLADGAVLSLNDSTSNVRNLVNTNGATGVAGQIDGAVNLVQANTQYLSNSVATIPIPVAISYEVWVKPASFPGAYNTLLSTNGVVTAYFDLHIKSIGKLAIYANTTSGNLDYDGTGSHTLVAGTWYYIGVSYNSATGLIGYVNAAVDGTAGPIGSNLIGTYTRFDIGSNLLSAGGREFDGIVDEVRVSNVARSADWFITSYNNQNNPTTFINIGPEISATPAIVIPFHHFYFGLGGGIR